MKNSLLTKNANLLGQLVRYIISGGVAFALDFTLLWVLTQFCELNYLLSTVIAYIVGLVTTYLLSIFWIFDARSSSSWVREMAIFTIIGLVGLLLTWSLMWVFTDFAELHYLISKIIVTAIVFLVNFLLKKIILFSRKNPS